MSSTDRLVEAYLQTDADKKLQALCVLLDVFTCLRAMHLMHWNIHWQLKSENFYGAHLLFERLYDGDEDGDGLQGEVDALAEKLVGYFGTAAVDPVITMKGAVEWLERWAEVECLHRRGLLAEEDLQTVLKNTYDTLKAIDVLPLGLDDWIMATASAHETNIYLIQQSLAGRNKAAAALPAAPSREKDFFDNPQKREVREFADSKAVSNAPDVAEQAAPELDEPVSEVEREVRRAPPTPSETVKQPGGQEFSTLNRFVVETDEPDVSGVPKSHEEIPKHPDISKVATALEQMWWANRTR